MRILFIGDLRSQSRSLQRLRTLEDMGHHVTGISFTELSMSGTEPEPSLFDRICFHIGRPIDTVGANESILGYSREVRFDLVWVEKGLMIRPETLRAVRGEQPQATLVFHSEDDMAAAHNQSIFFRSALPLYDVVFTHKSYNRDSEELQALGAKRVVYLPKSFDASFHRPIELAPNDRERVGARVGFVGTFEEERASSLLWLCEQGIDVRVFGNGWSRWTNKHPLLIVEDQPIYGEDYVRAINATDINLGFLRKANRDLHTDRSVEIPACGAFLLAERTQEHQHLFEEGSEAEYFGSHAELLMKVRYYLRYEEERRSIAAAGRARCLSSGYSHEQALETMLAACQPVLGAA